MKSALIEVSMEQLWFQHEGSWFMSTLSGDQRAALIIFFGGKPDEVLLRLRMRKIPPRLKRETLQGYLTHVIEPTLRAKNDLGTYMLNRKQHVGMQAFRKQLILEAIALLK
jgi:hypothetical protein